MTRRPGAVVLMVLATLIMGGITAGIGNWIGWRLATPAPTEAQTRAVLRTALPDAPVAWTGWHDDVRDWHGVQHPDAGNLPGQQQAGFSGNGVDRAAFDAARGRLDAAGWHTAAETGPEGRAFFVADRDGMVLEWEFVPAGFYSSPPGASIEVWAWRFTPLRVKALTVGGWLLGGVLGWWSVRRLLRSAPGRRRSWLLVTVSVLIGIFALSTGLALWFTVDGLLDRAVRDGQPIAVWFAYFPFLLPFGFQLG